MGPKNRLSWESDRLSPMTKYSPGRDLLCRDPGGDGAGHEPGLLERLAVDHDLAPGRRDRVTGQADDALDQVLHIGPGVLARGRGEDHDVAPVHGVEVVADLSTRIRSPIMSVGSIDAEGMKKVWTTKVRIPTATSDGHHEHDGPLDEPAAASPGPARGRRRPRRRHR